MKKKVVSLIMSVALAFSSMHVMNIAAENVKAESNLTEATVTNLNGYEFIDITSNKRASLYALFSGNVLY